MNQTPKDKSEVKEEVEVQEAPVTRHRGVHTLRIGGELQKALADSVQTEDNPNTRR